MSKLIKPVGKMMLVKIIAKENFKTEETNIELVNNELSYGEVMELSDELKDLYKVGDEIIFPEGAGKAQFYKKEHCLWLNGLGRPAGDVWGIVTKETPKKR